MCEVPIPKPRTKIPKSDSRQITKYLNECRSRESEGPGFKETIKSKIRKSPPPVPQPDYITGAADEEGYCDEGWDTDFDDDFEDEADVDTDNKENGYTDAEVAVFENETNNVNGNNRKPINDIIRKFETNSAPEMLPHINEERITHSTISSGVEGRVKPEILNRGPIPRPPPSVTNSNSRPRPQSIIARPQQHPPPPPPTAPKPNITFNGGKTVPTVSPKNCDNRECESPPNFEDNCDNYEIPTSSNNSENNLGSFSSHVASSTISLLSAGSSSQDSMSPSQTELNREFLEEEEDYEIPDVESQCSGSSGVSVRSSPSDRPALPPKPRPSDINIPPPPLPEKPNRRSIDPPRLPARDRILSNKKQEDNTKSRHKSGLDGCKQVISSLLTNLGTKMTPDKRADSTSRVDKLSPEKEFIPTLEAVEMIKSNSMLSLRPSYSDTAALVNTRPLPPLPGDKPIESHFKDSLPDLRLPSSPRKTSIGIYLETFPWFHKIERDEAETVLKKSAQSGSYLVRESRRAGVCNPFTLSIFFEGKISHLNIRKRSDGKFALGKEKENEKTFSSVEELISFHQTEPILLTAGGQPIGKVNLLHCYEKHNR